MCLVRDGSILNEENGRLSKLVTSIARLNLIDMEEVSRPEQKDIGFVDSAKNDS